MNLLLIALLLQSPVVLPARTSIENPARATQVPKKLQKDYNKVWILFLKGKDDKKVLAETDKILKKDKDFVPALLLQFYVHAFAGRNAEAERRLEAVLALRPADSFALYYFAEAAYSRQEFARASDLYGRLLADKSRFANFFALVAADAPDGVDLERKRQKALLLGMENLLRTGARAAEEGRLAEAEDLYRQALRLAPQEASLHGQLAELLFRQRKWDEAIAEFQRQNELRGAVDAVDAVDDEAQRKIAEALTQLGRVDEARATLDRLQESDSRSERLEREVASELEDLGRWGQEIGRYREVASAPSLTREQLAWMIVRYFPQIVEFQKNPQIVTDIRESWAQPEIQIGVDVGLSDPMPNHTFQPARTITLGEFATAMARLSRLLGVVPTRTTLTDMPGLGSTTDLYRDLHLVLDLGLAVLQDTAAPDLFAAVRGKEAVNACEKLLLLAGKKTP